MTKANANAQGQAVLAELALLREADEARAVRVSTIEQLQLPIVAAVLEIMHTKPMAEALPLLEEQAQYLTDGRQSAVANLIANARYAADHLAQEAARIEAMRVAAEAAKSQSAT